jgi:hypothetical protein
MPAPTERALFERLRRKLRHEGQTLHRCRESSRDFPQLGRYFITDSETRGLVAGYVDLADWLESLQLAPADQGVA